MTDTVTIRPYQSEDLEPVLDLLRVALGETPHLRRTQAVFAWKHLDNPFGPSLMLIAEAAGTVAGFRAFMRWELTTPGGQTVKCVRAVDTATHPEYQRRGIFRRLTLDAIEVARADGVELVFNTPNRRSGAGYSTMGWTEVGGIGVLVRPSRRMLSRHRAPANASDPADFIEQPKPVTDLDPPQRAALGLRTPRRPEYLDWRFRRHPTARYLMVGDGDNQAILRPSIRNGRRELVISDLFGPNPGRAVALATRRSRSDYLVASFRSGTPERRAVLRSGLVPVPWTQALNLYAHPLTDLPLEVTALESWDLALSDLELL